MTQTRPATAPGGYAATPIYDELVARFGPPVDAQDGEGNATDERVATSALPVALPA